MSEEKSEQKKDVLPIASSRDAFGYLRGLLRPRRVLFGATLAVFVLEAAAGMVAPWVLGWLVDSILEGRDDRLWSAFTLILVAAIAGALLSVLAVSLLARVIEPALAELRSRVMQRALGMDQQRLEKVGSGDVLSRVGDDSRLVATQSTEVVPEILAAALAVLLTSIGLVALDWRLALAGLVAVPSYLLGLRWYLPRTAPLYARERAAMGERAQALLGAVNGLPTLHAYRTEGPAIARVEEKSRETMDVSVTVFGIYGGFSVRINRSELFGLLALLIAGFFLVDADVTTVGQVTTAALLFHRLFGPIGALLFLVDEIQSTFASLTRLVGVATMPEPEPGRAEPGRRGVTLTDLRHSYLPGHPVVDGVTLELPPGHRVGLVGATGAGKTTVAAIAAGTLPPTGGSVRLGEHDLASVDPDLLRRRISLVSQEVHVFAVTLRDNLTLAALESTPDDARLREVLRRVGARWADDLSEGLDTLVGDDGHRLTAAQAQQVALARVLLVDPEVVVLDEASAEAGSLGARELDAAATAVTADRAAIVVAHRLTQARACDEILVLDHGRVVERGSHDDLVADGGRYADLWAAWSGDRAR